MKKPWRSRDRGAELDREIQDHLDLDGEAQQRVGLPDDEAKRAARHVFGNPAIVREDVREAWGWQWIERLWLDTRLAVRLWARTPGFSAIAIATIGLGIGASTALVGQVKAVFWTPLPVTAPQELRTIAWTSPRHPFVNGPNVMAGPRVNGAETFGTVSYPAYLAMRDEATAFSDIACWADLGEARPVILGELGFGTVQFVSGNYFRTLGVRAALGRTIEPQDQAITGWSPVAMVSTGFGCARLAARRMSPAVRCDLMAARSRSLASCPKVSSGWILLSLPISSYPTVRSQSLQRRRTRSRTADCGTRVELSRGWHRDAVTKRLASTSNACWRHQSLPRHQASDMIHLASGWCRPSTACRRSAMVRPLRS